MTTNSWDAIVIGGGAAGLSAAQMLGRARRRTLVIDEAEPRNRFASHMHGVLGHDGTAPADLIARGRAENALYGIETTSARVTEVREESAGLAVHTGDRRVLMTRSLVLTTGIVDELPDIPGLAARWGRSVLHCPYCHGWEVRDRALGVLPTSPLGVHQAEMVRQWSDRVVVFTGLLGDLDGAVRSRLMASGIRVVDAGIGEVVGDDDSIRAIRLDDGEEVEIDALFTAGTPRPRDGFLVDLDLERAETPWGWFIRTDPAGKTSHPRVWAAGNVVSPTATVPMAMGAGSMAGAAVNGALVAEDFDLAEQNAHRDASTSAPAEFWEERYAGSTRVWSGSPNRALAAIVPDLESGRALDLGCGEGADVIWLAQQGWDATGLDISTTAVARARAAATASGVPADRVRFLAADLSTWTSEESFDLVTASFFQSPVALDRHRILHAAASLVTSGGHLLVVSHAAPPAWSPHRHSHHGPADFPTPAAELRGLELDPDEWTPVIAEVRRRPATAPDGTPAELDDTVVLLQRR